MIEATPEAFKALKNEFEINNIPMIPSLVKVIGKDINLIRLWPLFSKTFTDYNIISKLLNEFVGQKVQYSNHTIKLVSEFLEYLIMNTSESIVADKLTGKGNSDSECLYLAALSYELLIEMGYKISKRDIKGGMLKIEDRLGMIYANLNKRNILIKRVYLSFCKFFRY